MSAMNDEWIRREQDKAEVAMERPADALFLSYSGSQMEWRLRDLKGNLVCFIPSPDEPVTAACLENTLKEIVRRYNR